MANTKQITDEPFGHGLFPARRSTRRYVDRAPNAVTAPPVGRPRPPGIHGLLGEVAWRKLPSAVRERFREPVPKVDYVGEFDVVRASVLGRVIAWLCQAIG